MKFWNKSKEVREQCWHKVFLNREFTSFQDLKRSLQLYPSPGKFYMWGKYGGIEFERKEDAVYFTLLWG